MFRQYLEELRKSGNVETVTNEVKKEYEIGRYLEDFDGDKVVEFPNVKDSTFVLLGNVCASRDALAKSMGIARDKLHGFLLNALSHPSEPEIVEDAQFLKNVDEKPNLKDHPIPRFYKEDAGYYYTSGLIVTKALDTGVHNSSIHRQLLISKNETTARIVPRHLFHNIKIAEARDEDLPIAVVFGLHPAVILAASTPTAISVDEMDVANTLLGGRLKRVRLPNNGILVPDHAEVVYEGVVLKHKKHKEGPFVDVTGTLDKIRNEPQIRIDRVYYRNNPYFTTILPSKTEHFILMGLGREAKIRESVLNVVPHVGDVLLTNAGGGWLHAIVSIDKQTEGDGKNVIFAAFAGHGSLKWVVVVDTDVNIHDQENVDWAMITRTGHDDIIVVPQARGSSLDPAMDETTKTSIKVGIDATKSLYRDSESYRRISIPRD